MPAQIERDDEAPTGGKPLPERGEDAAVLGDAVNADDSAAVSRPP